MAAIYVVLSMAGVLLPPVFPTAAPYREVCWGIGGLMCVGIGAATWRRSHMSRPVALGAGWVLLVLAAYLSFVVADLLASLTVLPLAVAILSVIAGRVLPRTRKILLSLHVALSGSFLGVAVVMVTLTVFAAGAGDIVEAHRYYMLLEIFDVTLLPWVTLLSIMSGLAVSLTGKWGLVRHYWVLAKFVLATLALASGLGVVHTWVVNATRDSARLVAAAGRIAELGTDPVRLIVGFGVGGVMVLAATVLSVVKPWGRTRFGRRAAAVGTVGTDSTRSRPVEA